MSPENPAAAVLEGGEAGRISVSPALCSSAALPLSYWLEQPHTANQNGGDLGPPSSTTPPPPIGLIDLGPPSSTTPPPPIGLIEPSEQDNW